MRTDEFTLTGTRQSDLSIQNTRANDDSWTISLKLKCTCSQQTHNDLLLLATKESTLFVN